MKRIKIIFLIVLLIFSNNRAYAGGGYNLTPLDILMLRAFSDIVAYPVGAIIDSTRHAIRNNRREQFVDYKKYQVDSLSFYLLDSSNERIYLDKFYNKLLLVNFVNINQKDRCPDNTQLIGNIKSSLRADVSEWVVPVIIFYSVINNDIYKIEDYTSRHYDNGMTLTGEPNNLKNAEYFFEATDEIFGTNVINENDVCPSNVSSVVYMGKYVGKIYLLDPSANNTDIASDAIASLYNSYIQSR